MFGSCSSVGDAGVSCAQNGTAGLLIFQGLEKIEKRIDKIPFVMKDIQWL
jgi:hypothetical protein